MKAITLITALLLIIPLAAGIPFAVLPDVGVNGTVRDAFGNPIEGALVDILSPLELNNITDQNGNYFIRDVPAGTYDILASAQDKGFESKNKQVTAYNTNVTTVDFTLYTAGSECQPDCSKTNDEIPVCHMDCEGINGCHFNNTIIMNKCTRDGETIGVPVGNTISYNETHKARCCEGSPYLHKKISGDQLVFPESENIVRITRIVFFRGQFVRMIIDVFK